MHCGRRPGGKPGTPVAQDDGGDNAVVEAKREEPAAGKQRQDGRCRGGKHKALRGKIDGENAGGCPRERGNGRHDGGQAHG